MNGVVANNVSKSYGEVKALDNCSFTVAPGETFGVIGPDGAGKTTLMRILTTLLLMDGGKASVANLDVVNEYKKIRGRVGYMPGKFSLYQDLTVSENLKVFAAVFNTTVNEHFHLIEDVYNQIAPFKNRKAGALSGGMKQKLALCCALIHKPEVLFLDEPTTGVDPISRKEFWDVLKKLKTQGITIIVSTPYMDEAARCDRIAFIQEGKMSVIDTPENIIRAYPHIIWSVKAKSMFQLLNDLRKNEFLANSFAFGDAHHVTLKNANYSIRELKDWLMDLGHADIEIIKIEASIEDCFMAIS